MATWQRAFTRFTHTCILLCAALLLFASAERAQAQTLNGTIYTIDQPAPFEVQNLRIVINRSVTINAPVDIAEVIIGDSGLLGPVNVNSDRQLLLTGIALGSTNFSLIDAHGSPIAQYNLEVTPDLRTLQSYLDRLIPNSFIEVDYVNDTILLTGTVGATADRERAGEIADLFSDTGALVYNDIVFAEQNQVAIEVRVVELDRSVNKELGFNFAIDEDPAPDGLLAFDGIPGGSFDVASGPFHFTVNKGFGDYSLISQIKALEGAGYTKTLADTVVTALSGETGYVQSGGQLRVFGADGAESFKPYGVQVRMTPTISSSELIRLEIEADVSSVDADRSLLNRTTQTTVELPSGETMMIAGLIYHEQADRQSGVPILKSIPLLGQLFRERVFRDRQKELVIMITPHLARSSIEQANVTPADGFFPADDIGAIVGGELTIPYKMQGDDPRNVRFGHGFIQE